MREPLRLAIAQLDARPGDVLGNVARVVRTAAAVESDLLLTPELSLTGYDLRDTVHELATPLCSGAALTGQFAALADVRPMLVAGLVERGQDDLPYNAAVVLEQGRVRSVHRKLYLPTYGMFDEARYFGSGQRVNPVRLPGGWQAGLLVCEDFWHPGLSYVLAATGIDVLLVLAAAPGRGAWQGGEHGDFASADVWERIARTTAHLYGLYVALANRAGVEGGVTFAGGSLLVAPDGEVVVRAGSHEHLLEAVLDPAELTRARRPAYHRRDDRPALIASELQRLGLA